MDNDSSILNTVFDLISEHAHVSGHPPFFVNKKKSFFLIIFNFVMFYFNINNYFK